MIFGVDPGVNGSIACRSDTGLFLAYKMPKTDEVLISLIDELVKEHNTNPEKKNICFLEKVSGFMGFKDKVIECPSCKKNIVYKAGDPGSRMFVFGENYGSLKMVFKMKMEVNEITPQTWIKALALGKKSQHKNNNAWKSHLADRARVHYPGMKVIQQTADALLILKYGLFVLRDQYNLPF